MVRAVQDADSGEDHATFFPTSLLATLTLSQLLEKHVLALKGAVRLAKVNIDALPQLAAFLSRTTSPSFGITLVSVQGFILPRFLTKEL